MDIKTLYDNYEISLKEFNVCRTAKIKSIEELILFKKEHGDFTNIKSCGRNTSRKLLDLCKEYEDKIAKLNAVDTLARLKETPQSKLPLINRRIKEEFTKLSVRSRNGLLGFLKKDLSLSGLLKSGILSIPFEINSIPNVGQKSKSEIQSFLDVIRRIDSTDLKPANPTSTTLLNLLEKRLDLAPPTEAYHAENPMQLLEILFRTESLSNSFNLNKTIIKISLNDECKDFDELHNKLSKERIRQIRKTAEHQIAIVLKLVQPETLNEYIEKLLGNGEYIRIKEEDFKNKFNKLFNTNFNSNMVFAVLSICPPDNHEVIKLGSQHKTSHWLKAIHPPFAIATNKFARDFYLKELIGDLNTIEQKTRDYDISTNLRNYLKVAPSKVSERNFQYIERFITTEFNCSFEAGKITFKRNTDLNSEEVVINALEHFGKPTHFGDIVEWVYKTYDHLIFNEAKFRRAVNESSRVKNFGKAGLFGLATWAKNNKYSVKSTLRDTLIQILQSEKKPLHVLHLVEILDSLGIESVSRSIITNLQRDPSQKIMFLPQNFIGLKGHYSKAALVKYNNIHRQLGKVLYYKVQSNPDIQKHQLIEFIQKEYGLNEKECGFIIEDKKFLKFSE